MASFHSMQLSETNQMPDICQKFSSFLSSVCYTYLIVQGANTQSQRIFIWNHSKTCCHRITNRWPMPSESSKMGNVSNLHIEQEQYCDRMNTCLFRASKVSSLRSLLAVMPIFPKPGTPNSFSMAPKNFRASQDKYARSPESNLMPTALYLQSKPSKITCGNRELLKSQCGKIRKRTSLQEAMQIKDRQLNHKLMWQWLKVKDIDGFDLK